MQAAQVQLKTESGAAGENVLLRIFRCTALRRAAPVLLALLVALMAASPVSADETEGVSVPDAETAVSSENAAEDYTAVAAQLQAVARAEGRAAADKMLYGALRGISAAAVNEDDAESAALSSGTDAKAPKAVVVNASAQAGGKWSAKGLLPFIAVVLLALFGLFFAVRPMRRRRVVTARAYRPMRDRTLRDSAFQRRAHSSL